MVHANACLTPKGRTRLASAIVEDGWTHRRAAERFQCSPATAKKWADRYRAGGVAAMQDRSSRPHSSPARICRRTESRILGLRFTRRWGPHRIAYHLGIPRSTVQAVLHRYRMPLLRDLDQATGLAVRTPSPRRYEHDAPGDLVHVDIKNSGASPTGVGIASWVAPSATATTRRRAAVTRSSITPSMTIRGWRTQKSSAMNARRPPQRSGRAPARTSQTTGSSSNVS